MLLVGQKSAVHDLKAAYVQAEKYPDALPEPVRSRYILVNDFQTFEFHDLDECQSAAFSLLDLPECEVVQLHPRRAAPDRLGTQPISKPPNCLGGCTTCWLMPATKGRSRTLPGAVVFYMFVNNTEVFEPRDVFLDFIEKRTCIRYQRRAVASPAVARIRPEPAHEPLTQYIHTSPFTT